ncbi:MAG: DUF1003 domain-containing protein [Ferruginibacter sp.]
MHTFTSNISGNKFPVSERVSAKTLRDGILKVIQEEHPSFDHSCHLSVGELNHYRQQHISNILNKELGTLNELEKTVLDNINSDGLIANEAGEITKTLAVGERWADKIAAFGGSWKFIGIFMSFLVAWMLVNVFLLANKGFDPYPFILLNLILSCVAALQAPVIMMSQNRQEEKDRERAKNDYMVNLKSELEIRMLHEKIDHLMVTQQESMLEIQQIQVDMMKEMMEKIDRKSTR